jgi:hypothetical protein
MNDNIFDFGFTAVDSDELEPVAKAEAAAGDAQTRLEKLYNAVQPLLNNLKKNPEKDYIYWPKRLAKIEDFERMINEIYEA